MRRWRGDHRGHGGSAGGGRATRRRGAARSLAAGPCGLRCRRPLLRRCRPPRTRRPAAVLLGTRRLLSDPEGVAAPASARPICATGPSRSPRRCGCAGGDAAGARSHRGGGRAIPARRRRREWFTGSACASTTGSACWPGPRAISTRAGSAGTGRGHAVRSTRPVASLRPCTCSLAMKPRRGGWRQTADDAPPDLPWPDPLIAAMTAARTRPSGSGWARWNNSSAGAGRARPRVLRDIVRDYPDAHSFVTLGIELSKLGVRRGGAGAAADRHPRASKRSRPITTWPWYSTCGARNWRHDRSARFGPSGAWGEAVQFASKATGAAARPRLRPDLPRPGASPRTVPGRSRRLAGRRRPAKVRRPAPAPGKVLAATGNVAEGIERLRIAVRQSEPGDDRAQRAGVVAEESAVIIPPGVEGTSRRTSRR